MGHAWGTKRTLRAGGGLNIRGDHERDDDRSDAVVRAIAGEIDNDALGVCLLSQQSTVQGPGITSIDIRSSRCGSSAS